MAFDNRLTYLCYDNSDLIRDGFIRTKIEKEYIPVDTFRVRRLINPPKGVNYIVTRDKDTKEIIAVKEVKKLLPASKIKIEIDFSKVMRDAVSHPIQPGSLGFNPMVNMIASPMLGLMGFGGITSGLSYFTVHILDAETKFNRKITVTKEMINTGIWECDEGYPLSIFGIVPEFFMETVGDDEGRFVRGLEFDANDSLKDPDIIGKYSDGVWKGNRRKRISGATDSNGLFGGAGDADIKFENVAYDEQPQLFDKIVMDKRTLKFRGDNYDATGGKDYPFKLTGVPGIDVTNKQIRLKITDDNGVPLVEEGDNIYITYSVAIERHVRQNLNHRGDIGQGNTVGMSGFRGAIKSEVDAFDYQISTWKVPLLPIGLGMSNIDDIDSFYTSDSDYKLTLFEYIAAREFEENGEDISTMVDTLEGWRLSESITNGHITRFWAADYRGILLYDDGFVKVVYPESLIRDKEWFINYLKTLPFIYSSGGVDADGNPIYVAEDFRKKLEDRFDEDRQPGFLFDLTDATSSILFDREKLPYYRPFANALKNISKYSNDDEGSGIGIIFLDLIDVLENDTRVGYMDLEIYDLSYVEFYHSNAQPIKSYSCDEPFDIHSYHYWSESYDGNTLAGGMGAWYDGDHIDNDVMGWYPSGSSIESYWKLETPYFCGNYTRRSRIYTEKLSGPSLDNFSWIFTDTEPFVPYNISSDTNQHFDESIVVFNDDDVHNGLCYNMFVGSNFDEHISVIEVDDNKSHIKDPYDHDKDMIVGQNRMIADTPSYSNGIPIVDDVVRICREERGEEFWFSEEIYAGASYGLSFRDDTPKANIPSDWYIRKLTIDFSLSGFDDISDFDKYVSFYFEGSETSISEIKIIKGDHGDSNMSRMIIDFKYYYNGPLQFLGDFWKNINISSVEVRYTTVNDPRNQNSLDIEDYRLKTGQNAVVYDGMGRLLVFHSNTDSGNIDVAVSYDDGRLWTVHKSLIRLISGEVAGLPFAIRDDSPEYIHLFYTLNDVFLMYKRINTDYLDHDDAFVESKVPSSYDVDSYDQKLTSGNKQFWPEKVYWGEYSDEGNYLRRYPSYFIAGDADDPYFIKQMDARDALNEDYKNSPSTDIRQYARFEFAGNYSHMKDAFRGEPYSVFMDEEGVLRLFMISDGKLSVKRSNNYFTWKYDIEEQVIHKDFIDDQLNKGIPEEIRNIQVVRNDYTAGWTSTLYFHAGMLFIRHFQTDLLFPFYDSNGDMNNLDMKKHIEMDVESTTLPIFLVGKIPDDILAARLREIDSGEDNSELFIYFPYDEEMLKKFDDRFSVDVDTQVYAFTTKHGVIRIFYKDSFGNLNGIILDSLTNSNLEVMNKFKVEKVE